MDRRPGISLLELIVVLAIIAVLIGLLLPAVQAVRRAAHGTQCANRQKHLALAAHSYAAENGGAGPVRVSVPEVRKLLLRLVWAAVPDAEHEPTGGRLHPEVVTTDEFRKSASGENHYPSHRFESVAPAPRYRHQLFVCEPEPELVYPVEVEWPDDLEDAQWASDQTEFENTVGKCLTSRRTVSVLQSLLARTRESENAVPA